MGDCIPLSDRQKAFRSGDGLAENVVLLKGIIKHHTDNNLPLNVVFLDIAKAFDSVSYQSILIAARRIRGRFRVCPISRVTDVFFAKKY